MRSDISRSNSEDRIPAILDAFEEPALLLDAADTIVHLNQAAAEIFGVDRNQLFGQSVEQVGQHCLNCATIRAALDHAKRSGSTERRIELEPSAHSPSRSLLLKLAALRTTDGNGTEVLVTLHGVSTHNEPGGTQDEGIVAVAEHFNTPLTSLSLAVGLLQREGEKQNDLVRQIVEDVNRLNHSSADFLNRIREHPRSISVRNVQFDLLMVVNLVSRKLEARIRQKKITFAVHAENNVRLAGDPLKLSWVLAMLVSNAVSHTPETGKIDITAEKEDNFIRISVWDSGPGIPAHMRDAVFGDVDAVQYVGAGFGLAMAKEIVEAHRGKFFAERLEDGGRVTLTLPLLQEV
jgi:PAS domain S-box-containing protein